ncbi:hypothetical protein B488_10340 [Liberibacter crescens BT-1]|uniref:Histidine phosphotransferase ChpT C-terminal domain-containing protein n=1 Tax=Liberibacter crescens (strain BT-1) TaxID=1215343 RepID=L0EXD7_LIBCB|nr:histidine phosphotransferase family protein [Liberibacter crescens]AGA65026.1 hypothetical protein B488_10340 [Liberibacter crescens BT-1]AMC13032.1 histidine phosphotransferase [Liberibacter crescens]
MINTINFNLSASDLSSLLCSRICHDLISPVGAVNNGLELLDEGAVDDKEALDLIRISALHAIVRLKFLRLALGYFSKKSSLLDFDEIEKIIKDFIDIEKKVSITWERSEVELFKDNIKLLLNLFMVSYHTIPKGGDINISITNSNNKPRLSFMVKGDSMRVPKYFIQILSGAQDVIIDSYNVHFYYTVLLAHENGISLSYEVNDENIFFIASVK